MERSDDTLTAFFSGHAGVAREDITPPVGIYARNWGAATHDAAEGVHRPLTATALALSREGSEPLLLIAVDLGRWRSLADEWLVRGALLQELGLDASHALICLSHTHAGPSVFRDDADKPGGHLIAGYLELLRERIVRVASAALAARRPARLSWRYGRCDLARNRDRPDEGRPRHIVGLNPDVPADDTLLVGRLEDAGSGAILGVIVNYA